MPSSRRRANCFIAWANSKPSRQRLLTGYWKEACGTRILLLTTASGRISYNREIRPDAVVYPFLRTISLGCSLQCIGLSFHTFPPLCPSPLYYSAQYRSIPLHFSMLFFPGASACSFRRSRLLVPRHLPWKSRPASFPFQSVCHHDLRKQAARPGFVFRAGCLSINACLLQASC